MNTENAAKYSQSSQVCVVIKEVLWKFRQFIAMKESEEVVQHNFKNLSLLIIVCTLLAPHISNIALYRQCQELSNITKPNTAVLFRNKISNSSSQTLKKMKRNLTL